jgi:CubicO group peptidase (beta-lactamase class C family)
MAQNASRDHRSDAHRYDQKITRIIDAFRRGMPPSETHGETHAVVAWRGGREVFAAYGTGYTTPCGPDVTHISWSMAKSVTHALVGFLVADGRLDIDSPVAASEWADDGRARITMRHLLEMRPGLEWVEDYVDGEKSHVIDMLFGAGSNDHAAYAAALPLVHEPGTHWVYSSGTTNIICRVLGDLIGGGREGGESPAQRRENMTRFINERLLAPLKMSSATAKFDAAGNFVGSSYVYATATDFARFGRLYVAGRSDAGGEILPVGWVDAARTPVAVDPETGNGYGHHWWTWPQIPGALVATGYEGQYTIVLPDDDLVVVRLGKTSADIRTNVVDDLVALVDELRR